MRRTPLVKSWVENLSVDEPRGLKMACVQLTSRRSMMSHDHPPSIVVATTVASLSGGGANTKRQTRYLPTIKDAACYATAPQVRCCFRNVFAQHQRRGSVGRDRCRRTKQTAQRSQRCHSHIPLHCHAPSQRRFGVCASHLLSSVPPRVGGLSCEAVTRRPQHPGAPSHT